MLEGNKSNPFKNNMYTGTSASFFFWGIVATIGPLAASESILTGLNSSERLLFLLIGPIVVPVGNLLLGILSDLFGRRKIFFLSMLFYSSGIIIIGFSYSVITLILGLILAEFGVGGQEPSALSLVAENTDSEKRPFWLTIITNMNNIGSASIAFVFIFFGGTEISRILLVTISMLIAGIIIYTMLSTPESYIWERKKNKEEWVDDKKELGIENEGEETPMNNPIFSYVFLVIIGISQYLTFGLMAYVLAPVEFPGATLDAEIICVALAGASISGFIAAKLISRETKNYTFFSFAFGTLTTIIMLILYPYLYNMYIFMPLLFLNMAASEFAWASRSVLEPQVVGTGIRSTFIGLVRLGPMIAYPIFTAFSYSMSIRQFISTNLLLWALGLAASVVWLVYGIDVTRKNIDYGAKHSIDAEFSTK